MQDNMVSSELAQIYTKNGDFIERAPPYTAYLNGVAERANRY